MDPFGAGAASHRPTPPVTFLAHTKQRKRRRLSRMKKDEKTAK